MKTCDEPDLWKRLNAPQELDQIIVGPNVNQLIETRQILNGEVPRLRKFKKSTLLVFLLILSIFKNQRLHSPLFTPNIFHRIIPPVR